MISSALDSGRPLSRTVRRHITRCDGCRRFSEASLHLEDELRANAAQAVPPLAPAGNRPLLLRPAPLALTAAAGAVILVLALLVSPGDQTPTTGQQHPIETSLHAGFPNIAGLVEGEFTADTLVASLDRAGAAVFRQEMENLTRDGRAIADVVLAYLPAGPGSTVRQSGNDSGAQAPRSK